MQPACVRPTFTSQAPWPLLLQALWVCFAAKGGCFSTAALLPGALTCFVVYAGEPVQGAGDESKHSDRLAPLGDSGLGKGMMRRVVSLADIEADNDIDASQGLDDEMMDVRAATCGMQWAMACSSPLERRVQAVLPIMEADSAAQFATLYAQWCQRKLKPMKWFAWCCVCVTIHPELLLSHVFTLRRKQLEPLA